MFRTASTQNGANMLNSMVERLRGLALFSAPTSRHFRLIMALASLLALPMLTAVALSVMDIRIAGIDSARFALTAGLVGFGWLIGAHHVMSEDVPAGPVNEAPRLKRANSELERVVSQMKAEMAQLQEQRTELEFQLTIDPLTGVQNRRGLHAAFDAHGTGTVLALIDIDHFKKINDTLGHDVGDRVLKDFACMLRSRVDVDTPVYRVGGEEFVILFPASDLETIAARLDRFRIDLQADTFTRISDRAPISFSAGLALHTDANQTFDTVFKQADERLYAAKTAGRARTVHDDAAEEAAVLAA
ncbi:GGDEF domain-containing protein [Oceaniglobus indicus]|uniref:GGDEF domain-containing protein n=1 Tax=Oceaniglobus indicus TaxID=2047749 RepID=UPI001304529B|nr:GGDEF domain-containing protein [Oceaniglobus indicus]